VRKSKENDSIMGHGENAIAIIFKLNELLNQLYKEQRQQNKLLEELLEAQKVS